MDIQHAVSDLNRERKKKIWEMQYQNIFSPKKEKKNQVQYKMKTQKQMRRTTVILEVLW